MKQQTYLVTYKTFEGNTELIKVNSNNPTNAMSLVEEQVEDCLISLNAKIWK